jgi:HTH-like domain
MRSRSLQASRLPMHCHRRRLEWLLPRCAGRWVYRKPPITGGSSFTVEWGHRSCARCVSWRMRTRSSSALSRTFRWIRRRSKRCYQKSLAPSRRREIVHWVLDQFWVSKRRGCAALRFDRRTHRYKSVRPDQVLLRQRIREIAETRVQYGYRHIHAFLRREGWPVNLKRVHRPYRMYGLRFRTH